jgi:hypothetical protein
MPNTDHGNDFQENRHWFRQNLVKIAKNSDEDIDHHGRCPFGIFVLAQKFTAKYYSLYNGQSFISILKTKKQYPTIMKQIIAFNGRHLQDLEQLFIIIHDEVLNIKCSQN